MALDFIGVGGGDGELEAGLPLRKGWQGTIQLSQSAL